jgi:hypothetical protein
MPLSARKPVMDHPLVGAFFLFLLVLVAISWARDSRR